MRKMLVLCVLLAGAARADAPSLSLVRKHCVDGQLQGIVIEVREPGVYGLRWGDNFCKDEV